MEQYLGKFKAMAVLYAPNVVMALLTLIIGFWLANKASQVLSRMLRNRHVEETVVPFLGSLVSGVLKVVVLSSVAGKFGVETTSFIALVGGAGLALGLALQGSLGHFASGVMLLVFRPYKVGDLINAAGFTGEVESIQIFNTVLKTNDNKRIFIPNGSITAGPITNISGQGTIRVDMIYAIAGDESIEKARVSVQKAADACPLIHKNPPVDILVNGHEVGITKLDVRPWCNSAHYWDVYYFMQENVKNSLWPTVFVGPNLPLMSSWQTNFNNHFTMRKIYLVAALLVATTLSLCAQDIISLGDTTTIDASEAPMSAPVIMAEGWNQTKTKFFTLNIGLALILDHNIVVQDDTNIEQVGDVAPGTEFRGERLILSGNLNFIKHPWRYMISANYNGLDAPQGQERFSFIDWNLEIPFGKKGGWLTIGKQKEGVGHEYVAPGTQLMFMERGSGVPPLIRQRNIGVRYSNSILQHRATYTLGLFNNYWETDNSFSDNGSQVTFRTTGLPMYTSDRDLLHVAVGYRYSGAVNGALSYKAKPETNTAPSFISTGTLDANNSNTIMLEAIKVHEQFSFIAEYMYNVVGSSANGNPGFSYFAIGGGWFITGENRRYNKNTGNLGKLMPNKPFTFEKDGGAGAFEVAARYTHSDFTDGNVDGGTLGRFTGAFSWYLNAHMRLSVNYGLGKLEKGGLKGDANFWQFRAQFEL